MTNHQLTTWQQLHKHYQDIKDLTITDLFREEPDRLKDFTFELENLYVDFSLNRISKQAKNFLIQLAMETNLPKWINALFAGEEVNFTEHKAALHMLLRAPNSNSDSVASELLLEIISERNRMFQFAEDVRKGILTGSTGKKFTDIVTVGVGGSGLGPQLLGHALNHQDIFNLHFISSMDGEEIDSLLRKITAETTLFIIVSKSFTTIDTLSNAQTITEWLQKQVSNYKAHLVGVSEHEEPVLQFGIDKQYYFKMPAEVGGRYSLWSSVSLAIVIAIGKDEFNEFLAGGHIIDLHFKHAPLSTNISVILALLDIWYINFFQWQTRVILPYSSLLKEFPFYLQQLEMESCGKQINRNQERINYDTGPIIWGDVGFLGQHSFYQLLHQGTQIIPADFIVPMYPRNHLHNHQNLSLINALAQIKTLVEGYQGENVYQSNTGNRPLTVMLFPKLTPKICGMLIALYEHKVFTKSVIWGINPFDQWGVEAGKKLAKEYMKDNLHIDKNEITSSPLSHVFHKVNEYLSK